MDEKVENMENRRAQKRPHSPQKPEENTSAESVSSSEDVLQSDSKRDKLLRLLGGKKRKNETAASKWLERVRSREDELKVSTDLESQFNESLTKRVTGASRRHVGIGFKDDPPTVPTTTEQARSDLATPSTVNTQGTVVSSLSQRANITALSSQNPRQNIVNQPSFTQKGCNTTPGHPSSYAYNVQNNMPPQCYGYSPQMQNYGCYYTTSSHSGNIPPPPPPPDVKPPEPRSKNAFYAQFKKSS